ncbi:hypothetical protein QRZ85_15760, partial [Salmonella enterica]|nr:hypothetical protein [Salmonella enterica]
ILLRQKQKKLIMLPSETMIWQPEFTDKTLSRKPGAVHGAAACVGVKAKSKKETQRSLLESTMSPLNFSSCPYNNLARQKIK